MFNSKGTTSTDLSKKVDNVLNAFKTAIDGLNAVNTQAKEGIAAKEEEIKAAQTEKERKCSCKINCYPWIKDSFYGSSSIGRARGLGPRSCTFESCLPYKNYYIYGRFY